MFSSSQIVRRINEEFIPVALKAGLVNNPPPGIEGDLYREIGRSKIAPQGICVINSAAKVLSWVLMFDDDDQVDKFLDHCVRRYQEFPDASKDVSAQRFMRFPSNPLADAKDKGTLLEIPTEHSAEVPCPALPTLRPGTVVGTIVGRALDDAGRPLDDTRRQEHYVEARIEFSPNLQRAVWNQTRQATSERFLMDDDFARAVVENAYLGQLDVNPLGGQRVGGKTVQQEWIFWARPVETNEPSVARLLIRGSSEVAGSQAEQGARTDGRRWEHWIKLVWTGYIDIDVSNGQFRNLVFKAVGDETLRWGNPLSRPGGQNLIARLPAGRSIDLQCSVVYGLIAEPDKTGE